MVLLRPLIPLLICPAFLVVPVLFRILCGRFSDKVLRTVIFLKSIVLPDISSLRAVTTATVPATREGSAATLTITLTAVIIRPALTLRSAIFSCTSRSLLSGCRLCPGYHIFIVFPFFLLSLLQPSLLLLFLPHIIRLRRHRNRLLGGTYDLVGRILGLHRAGAVSHRSAVSATPVLSVSAALILPAAHLGIVRIAHEDDPFLLGRFAFIFSLFTLRHRSGMCRLRVSLISSGWRRGFLRRGSFLSARLSLRLLRFFLHDRRRCLFALRGKFLPHQRDRIILNRTLRHLHLISLSLQKVDQFLTLPV